MRRGTKFALGCCVLTFRVVKGYLALTPSSLLLPTAISLISIRPKCREKLLVSPTLENTSPGRTECSGDVELGTSVSSLARFHTPVKGMAPPCE